MALEPTVLYPLTLPALLDYILSTQSASSPTTLIVCSDRQTLLGELAHALKEQQETSQSSNLKQLLAPTLHNLSTTRHVKLAFCASVQALLAYLTAYDRPGYVHVDEGEAKERLVLVNLLALHKPTSSFSAQGLSRTLATAVDTALRTGAMLHLVECEGRRRTSEATSKDDMAMADGEEEVLVPAAEQDPWDQDVSILNISARRFGSGAGERAWAGCTVKAKRIAARWFKFHNLGDHHANGGLG
ncbi:uncharacterized protein M421DRAFT_164092 [Didymella exigua CBS 183.55]|uniref:Elongator complex protein 5 n=1 Tax=Didymella exigua CBS 183.55 TaxID=1150837 RepID=A0A6A5RLR8_9PLEO|nr:uncharacterized protein M421DRAFT_164092 [Didymella exigua CBS 183.55]KAF1927924.1 hypothetical protein M421DRAFT_164092 [Didymella exigua CBS 183.55]